ncbi:heat-inducible transcription repressor HrcA [candidate division KSB1 bacterium]|nr:heat-inducible transcription repressor HrcA [candidate division KSB1 bacterium]
MNPELTQRENIILQSIVQTFIAKASPVGSRYISKEFQYGLSSATIRNVMMDLEDKGYITQPHTSAGRVPTTIGYRYYVNGLMEIEELTQIERQAIRKYLSDVDKTDVETILEKASKALCKISNLLGVVLSPRILKGRFKKLELVKVNDNVLMVIISIDSGLVKTITLEVKSDISRDKLDDTTRILNERLSGLTLKEIRDTIDVRMQDVSTGDSDLLKQFVKSADRLFIVDNDSLYMSGAQNILTQPEFLQVDKMQHILELIDNKQELVYILNEYDDDEYVIISIGNENQSQVLHDCSLVTNNYKIGSVTGTVGVIGPTRMQYSKLIPLVEFITEELNNLFNK